MKIQLIIMGRTEQSQATENIWQKICEEQGLSLAVADSETEEGQTLVEKLALRTLPALVVNDRVVAVGQPDKLSARRILQILREKTDINQF